MVKLYELRPNKGTKKKKKRVGRGIGSGHGKTSTRGHKGQKSRTGSKTYPLFEGGQMPLARRIPKRGFNSKFKINYQIVNIDSLKRFKENTEITPQVLKDARLIRKNYQPIKILGNGSLTAPISVKAHSFSKSAQEKIKGSGGKIEIIK